MEGNKIFSTFWRRFFAVLLDTTFLGVFGAIIVYLGYELLLSLGDNAICLGIIISILYFTLGNSYVFKGQTLGKKITNIVVINKQGNYLSLKESFIRYFFLEIITVGNAVFHLLEYIFPYKIFLSISMRFSYIFFILTIINIIFVIFHKQKRGIHDLIAGSFVIHKDFLNISKEVVSQNYSFRKDMKLGLIGLAISLTIAITINILPSILFKNISWDKLQKLHFDLSKYQTTKEIRYSRITIHNNEYLIITFRLLKKQNKLNKSEIGNYMDNIIQNAKRFCEENDWNYEISVYSLEQVNIGIYRHSTSRWKTTIHFE